MSLSVIRTTSRRRRLGRVGLVVAAVLAVGLAGTLSAQAGGLYGFKEYKIPTENSHPDSITAGPDGNLWFTESAAVFDLETFEFINHIGRITPKGDITEFPVDCNGCALAEIVEGPDGALYFTVEADFPAIDLGRITTDGVVTFIDAQDAAGNPLTTDFGRSIVRHGNDLWGSGTGAIWRYDVTAGPFTEYAVPNVRGEVAVADDGIVWYIAEGGAIGNFDPETGAVGTATPVPDDVKPGGQVSTPSDVAVGVDGKVWFTDRFNDAVGYLDPTTGEVETFGTLSPESGPQDIKADVDGSMWFAQAEVGNVANITPAGVVTEAGKADPVVGGLEDAFGVAFRADPDGPEGAEGASVWFTKEEANTIGAVTQK